MKDGMKKKIKVVAVFLALAVLIEVFCFNYEWLFSLSAKSEDVTLTASESFTDNGDGSYTYPEYVTDSDDTAPDNPSFEITDIDKDVKYVYLDVAPEYEEEPTEACFDVYMIDEGFSEYYFCNTVRLHPSFEKTKYIRLHAYGDVKAVKFVTNYDDGQGAATKITVDGAALNARVPMFFSPVRVLILLLIFIFIYMFRPSSSLYACNALDESKKLRIIRTLFMGANIIIFALLIANNLLLINPSNATFRQYNLLAEAISQGRVNIDVENGSVIQYVTHPYDLYERREVLRQFNLFVEREPWHDIAYFDGNFYVYFGIVPALIFYLPLYLIAKVEMVTSAAFFITVSFAVVAAYELVKTVVKVYFPKTSFGVYLFASVIIANAVGTLMFVMSPIIYYIVVVLAVLFVMTGLMLWIKARYLIDTDAASKKINPLILFGALSMALAVGCRPTFAFASFLIIPIFWDTAIQNKKLVIKGNLSKYISAAVPYVIVAAGLMYYNFIRFGSPFDFGANYNLTTNDMNLRGFNLARLVDGFFMYIIEPPVIVARFPFLRSAVFGSNYIGYTFVESVYGGLLFTTCFVLFLFMLRRVKPQLKEEKLYSVIITILAITVFTLIIDIEMGGIKTRYAGDFIYLLVLGAVIVMLALFEKYGHKKALVTSMLVLGMITLAMHFLIAFNTTQFQPGSQEGYFNIYNFFI